MNFETSSKNPTGKQLEPILALFKEGNYSQVISQTRNVLYDFPNSEILFNIIGAANAAKKQFSLAIQNYQEAIKRNPSYAEAYKNKGNAQKAERQFHESIESYKAAIRIDNQYVDAYFNLGNTLRETNNLSGAIKSYESILTIDPNHAKAHQNLGCIFKEMGDLSKAIKCFQNAIEHDQTSFEAYFNLGNAFREINELSSAVSYYKAATKINPNYSKAYQNMGCTLQEMGNLSDAIKNYKLALKIDPNYSEAYYNLGNALFELDNFIGAKINYEKSIALNPSNYEAYFNLGNTLKKVNDLDGAISNYKEALKLNPNFAKAFQNIGCCLQEMENYKEAIENFSKVVNLLPNDCEANYNLGFAIEKVGEFDKATQFFKKALEINPKVAKSYIYNVNILKNEFTNVWQPGDGGRVLLWDHYQGIGDEIRFSSMYSEIQGQCSKFIAQIDPRLIPLFERSFSKHIEYRSKHNTVPREEYDKHLPLGYLDNYFRTRVESFSKTSDGWLNADEKKAMQIRNQLLQKTSKTLVGISWKTSSAKDTISLEELAKAFPVNDFKLVNLQYGNVNAEISSLAKNHDIEIIKVPEIDLYNDIDGLAALMWACDEVVSVCNLNTQLSGSMGKKTTVLLTYAPSFVWEPELKNNKSLWYSSVTQIRQDKMFSWNSVITKLKKHLGIED